MIFFFLEVLIQTTQNFYLIFSLLRCDSVIYQNKTGGYLYDIMLQYFENRTSIKKVFILSKSILIYRFRITNKSEIFIKKIKSSQL